MTKKVSNIKSRIDGFRKKFYLNLILRGVLISSALLLSIYLVINTLEYSFRFGSVVRGTLLLVFVISAVYSLCKFVFIPLYRFINHRTSMGDEEAARRIGQFFPNVSDRLLNIIQLEKSAHFSQSLLKASIDQKSSSVANYRFEEAIRLQENTRFLKYLAIPLLIMVFLLIVSPSLFKGSTERIVRFNEEFVPAAPFNFSLDSDLLAFKNEDFDLTLTLEGSAIPQNAYLIDGNRKIKMHQSAAGTFNYSFKKIQSSKTLSFEAAGFNSKSYTITVVNRPGLRNFNVYLDFPNYLNRKNETLSNVGNLQIPEGTNVKWQLKTLDARKAAIKFSKEEKKEPIQIAENELFEYHKTFERSDTYSLILENEYSENKDQIKYKVDVIKDQHPQINLNAYQDTLLYSYIALGGNIADDYGLKQLKLFYEVTENGTSSGKHSVSIPISKGQTNQRYYYQWLIDSLNIAEGNSVKYYLQVWDNDGVNGSKSSKTGTYEFKVPSKKELKRDIKEKSKQTEKQIDNRLEEAKELQEKIEEAEKRLKGKKELNWQDENLLKDIIKKREDLNKAIEELKKQNQNLSKKRERFNEQDERIKEKVEQLQKLMDELLDEETKKLYDELKKLLEEQKDLDEIQELLNEMNNQEDNLEKELERSLELFKRMKFDHELNEAINELEEQMKEQERLINETDSKAGEEQPKYEPQEQQTPETDQDKKNTKKDKNESLVQKQKDLQERFEEFEEQLGDLKKENQSLKNPESLPNTQEEQQSIKENQQKSKEQLQDNKRKPSKQSQQKAKEQMQKMADKMQQMQSSMEMTMMQENLDDLRDIVHNLIKLSFDQEDLMNEFSEVKQSDPRFIDLSQEQLKLKDDAKIVEDSLLSLANRVFQIASFVTREVGDMNDHMDKSVEAIRERKKPMATSEQQFAMTSMNNLALLLDDVLQQMQQAMADAMGKPKPDGNKPNSPSLSELQQQLNGQINQLKKSGKTGRQLSEELAKLAAEQERIRKEFEKMQEKLGEKNGGTKPGDGIPEKMEETETDLVNKQLTQETINRQKQILTRLLKAEKAMRERELDEERKGETAKDYEKALPKAFEEYFKLKEKEIELLKTVPPRLYPYYKKEVNEYFKRIEKDLN